MLFQVVQQTVEHHMVMRSPFAETFGKREIFIRNDVVYSCLDQVRAHVGKIGVTSVIVLQVVSCFLQAAGDRRQVLRFLWILHNTGSRLCRITTDDGCQSTVGAEAVGKEMSEQYPFTSELIHVDCHIGLSSKGFHQFGRKAFEYD